MAVRENGCVVTFTLLCALPALFGANYEFPKVSIVAYKPSGVRISIPDDTTKDIKVFTFRGRINQQLGDEEEDDISGTAMNPANGVWTIYNDNVILKIADVIHYNVHVKEGYIGYNKFNQTYSVKEVVLPSKPIRAIPAPLPLSIPTTGCRSTPTSVLSAKLSQTLCSGQIIFEDNFDEFRDDLWTIEQYIPSKPEYPFVSYQRTTVSVENGMLRIQPQLQENLPGFDSDAITYSTLDLSSGCTHAYSCVFASDGGHVLPPIASGRVTTKNFSFKYGSIEVRAKVPQGDWLYPDILLESLLKKYGAENYASGVMRIAGVLGNPVLTKGGEDYGNKVLFGGPMMDYKCRTHLLVKKISTTEWGNDFHVYSLRWAPEMIVLFVDGEEWGRILPSTSGLKTRLPKDKCEVPRAVLRTPMAPFDDYFSIILGVAAGGVSEFPDGVVSMYNTPKPWINTARRARLNFFQARDTWLSSWTQPALLVDYVKVRAL